MNRLLVRDCTVVQREGCSVYCENGRVVAVFQEKAPRVPSETEIIEANGGVLLPGFVDTHCHPFEYGRLKRSVDLRGTSNITGVRLRLQAGIQRAKPGEWITGRGWDQEVFPTKTMPRREDIDDISTQNPVVLSRVCGHIALLNSRAVEELNLGDRRSPEYERDQSGELTGVVKEAAVDEVYSHIPRSQERSAADLQSVEAEAARLGLTSLNCVLSPESYREELGALAVLDEEGSLSLRYRVYFPPDALEFVNEVPNLKHGGRMARINGVKIYADGSLGARTAALREPYADDPGNVGIMRYTNEELSTLVERVDAAGYQVIVHAIGDRAIEQAIEALGRVTGASNPRRHRIEHASLLPRDLRSKMLGHGIRAAVQPLFITSDTWAADRLGDERIRDLYPLRSMVAEGIIASGGSDSPVESLSPVLGMWASMTRGGYAPEEALDFDQALSLYTYNAESNGLDDPTTALAEGSPANFTLLDSDTRGMHPALFRKVGVLATVVDGKVVHSYGGS
jgi:predicted amidohydrolase YtcJ